MRHLDVIEPANLRLAFAFRDSVKDLASDAGFLRVAFERLVLRRGGPVRAEAIFPPRAERPLLGLAGRRVGVVASGGSGALACLCGVRRAFEEARVEAAAISGASGAMLFASLWAMGLDAEAMARFWLEREVRDYVDVDWARLGRAALQRFRGFGGLLSGEAIERTFRERFGTVRLGELRVPLSFPLWNIDRNRLEVMGTAATPDLELATAVRAAIAIPIFVEPVVIGSTHYGDGGVVDVFPCARCSRARARSIASSASTATTRPDSTGSRWWAGPSGRGRS